ncbi:MAG: ABC-F family ATP-binding cassette domain-containing protein [Magnetococcales bacterium]|nr:ABC-F family ATP-binding cassette domain-containing protein [Magnetococcales bacterium]
MLNIECIDKYFGQNCLFKEASLIVNPNEKVGFVGPNGTGKTTLFRLIEGTQEVDSGKLSIIANTRVGVLRQELDESHRSLLLETIEGDPELTALRLEREKLQQSLEDSSTQPLESVTNRMGEIEHRLEEIDAFRAESRAGAILLGLGFSKTDLDRPLSDFSGGWRMRVALARLLFSRADLMLLDEPTNHLDLESVAWLEKHLANMSGTVMIISHDRGFLNRVTKVTIALENHAIVRYAGSFDSYEKQREERRRLLIKSADRQDQEIEQIEKFINRFRAQANKAKQVQSRIKHLEKIVRIERPDRDHAPPVIRLPNPPPCAYEVLTLQGVSKQFEDNILFKKISLKLEKGKKVGLLGPNGAGKSSLLKIITSSLTADEGSVTLGDRVKIAHFAQHTLESLNQEHTIIESAQESAPSSCNDRELRTVLGGFLFSGDTVFKSVKVLSGGEKARLALARLFLSGANVLLLDEPTNHLDMGARAALQKALEAYTGTLIIITHDRDLMEGVCDHFWIVGNEKVTLWDRELSQYLEEVSQIDGEQKEIESQPFDSEDRAPPKMGNRELRQETARIRQTLSKNTKKNRERIKKIEKEIQNMESELKELETKLADPQLHENQDKTELKELVSKSGRLNSSLIEHMAEWEDLSIDIEQHELEAKNALDQLK